MLKDYYHHALVHILRKKQAKRPAKIPTVKPSRENVVSLMDALRRSIAAERSPKPAIRRRSGKPATAGRGARRRRPG
jgi:DNA end-binding protein Ku